MKHSSNRHTRNGDRPLEDHRRQRQGRAPAETRRSRKEYHREGRRGTKPCTGHGLESSETGTPTKQGTTDARKGDTNPLVWHQGQRQTAPGDRAGCRIEDQDATPFTTPPTTPPSQEQTPKDAFKKEHDTECRRRPSRGGQAFTCARWGSEGGNPLQSLKEGERRRKTSPLEWPPRRPGVSPRSVPNHQIRAPGIEIQRLEPSGAEIGANRSRSRLKTPLLQGANDWRGVTAPADARRHEIPHSRRPPARERVPAAARSTRASPAGGTGDGEGAEGIKGPSASVAGVAARVAPGAGATRGL